MNLIVVAGGANLLLRPEDVEAALAEVEDGLLLGQRGSVVSVEEAAGLGRRLLELGSKSVILELGAKGAYLTDAGGGRHFPVRQVTAIDATAAGDTFNGVLAVALAEQRDMADAIDFANAAASISVTRLGAQASIPARAEVDASRR